MNQVLDVLSGASKAESWGIEERTRYLEDHEALFGESFPQGTSIAVNLETFEFVSAATRVDALKLFVTTFGKSARGWVFEVGKPTFAGSST